MAKIPFDIKFKPQIESGEYKVVIEYDNRTFCARIVCWDFNSTEILVCVNYGDREDVLEYDSSGKHIGKSVGRPDLIIITPGPELTEFEDKLRIICENAVKEAYLSPWCTSEDFAKNHAAELLDLARKELCEELQTHEDHVDSFIGLSISSAYQRGKADALKDLPRWRKWENGACGNGQGIPLAIVKRGLDGYELVNALGIQGEQYIMLSDLKKLPGFNE